MKKGLIAISLALMSALFVLPMNTNAATLSDFGTLMLRRGSSGIYVVNLQATLNLSSCGSAGLVTDGLFGPITQSKVVAFQSSQGIGADGIVGPITKGRLVACSGGTTPPPISTVPGCLPGYIFSPLSGAPCNGTTPPPSGGGLNGSAGQISDVSVISSYNNEEVTEDDNDVKVAAFDVEASNDGDIGLQSMKIKFDASGSSGSTQLDDYIDSVSIWQGSNRIGTADVNDFTRDSSGIYTRIISLSNSIVRSDQTQRFFITLDSVSNLDSGDINGDSWAVDVENIRYRDGSGAITTDTSTGDIDSMNVPINFVDFGTAADTELKVRIASDSPDAGIVLVDNNSSTDNVVLLRGHLEAEGQSDITIDEIPITLVTSGDSISAISGSYTLKIENEEFSESTSSCSPSCSSNQTSVITFDNLNYKIDAGDTVDFEVLADINNVDNTGVTATDFDEGDTLRAELSSTNRGNIDAENEEGDQLSSGEKSGTAIGEAQEFRTQGVTVALIGTPTATVTTGSGSNDDSATFTMRFSVTASGDDIYIPDIVAGSGTNAILVNIDKAGTNISSVQFSAAAGAIISDDNADASSGGNFIVRDGTTENFTITVSMTNGVSGLTSGLYRMEMANVRWNTDDSSTTYNDYTSNLDTLVTGYVNVN